MSEQYTESQLSKRYQYFLGDQVGKGALLAETGALDTSFPKVLDARGYKYHVVDTCPDLPPKVSGKQSKS